MYQLSAPSGKRAHRPHVALLIPCLLLGGPALASDGEWDARMSSGNWSDAGNWDLGIVADGADSTAYFPQSLINGYSVNLDTERTIGHLRFGVDVDLIGENPLTLATTTGAPTIQLYTNAIIHTSIAGNQGFTLLGGSSSRAYFYGNNSYTGVTRIQGGGFVATTGGALGAAGAGNETIVEDYGQLWIKTGVTVNDSLAISGSGLSNQGALILEDRSKVSGSLAVNGDTIIGTMGNSEGTSTIGGSVTLSGGTILTVKPNDFVYLDFNGAISGNGGIDVAGPGVVQLWRENSFSGPTRVNGDLILNNDRALQNSTVQMNSPSLSIGNRFANPVFGGLSGAADLVLGSETEALYVGGNGEDTTYSGRLSVNALGKRGSGTLTLSGSNSQGSTIISDGVLVAAHNSALGSGDVQLSGGTLLVADGITLTNSIWFSGSGGTLGGSGTFQTDLTLGANTVVAPGASPGLLTVDGNYTQQTGSILTIEIGGLLRGASYDALDVTGLLSIEGGLLDVSLIDGFTPGDGDLFDILNWGSLSTGSAFDLMNLPQLSNGLDWNTDQFYTDGILSVVYTGAGENVPLPPTPALLAAGALAWFRYRRSSALR